MHVFVSYGAAQDQVTALRLQALGTVNGLFVYVPPAHTRRGPATLIDTKSAEELSKSDVVLGVIGTELTESCRQELNLGLASRKSMIVLAHPQSAPALEPYFRQNLVLLDPRSPELAEHGIVEYLKAIHEQQTAKNALLALGMLTVGLMLLAPEENAPAR